MNNTDPTKRNQSDLGPDFSRSSTLCAEQSTAGVPDQKQSDDPFHTSFLRRFSPTNTIQFQEEKRTNHITNNVPSTWNRRLSDLVVNWWLWELFSWVLSALCMCAIALVLGLYDNQKVPSRWPFGITLNAYISVLSAIAKYTLAVPVDEALGQLRWLWFKEGPPKPLVDFERFDDATRGPWGSFALLVHNRGRSLASLGASITLLSLALDPFFQQIVSYPERASAISRSYVPRSTFFWGVAQISVEGGIPKVFPDPSMTVAVEPYFLGNSTIPQIAAFCPTGNCIWQQFQTLGVCASCADASNLLQWTCLEESGDWLANRTSTNSSSSNPTNTSNSPRATSCGYFINATSQDPMLMSGYTLDAKESNSQNALVMRQLGLSHRFYPNSSNSYFNGSIHFRHINNPILDWITVSSTNPAAVYANQTPQAVECMLQWCVKSVEASYSNGQYAENITEVFTDDSNLDPRDVFGEEPQDGHFHFVFNRNITITPPGGNETYLVQNITHLQALVMFNAYVPGYLRTSNGSNLTEISIFNDGAFTGTDPQSQYMSPEVDKFLPPNDIRQHVDDMATTMTNVMRMYKTGTERIYGPGIPESFIRIQWGWFALPLILLVFTFILLIGTITRSQRQEDCDILKTSALAILANGLDDATRRDIGSSGKLLDLFERASEVEVSLVGRTLEKCTRK